MQWSTGYKLPCVGFNKVTVSYLVKFACILCPHIRIREVQHGDVTAGVKHEWNVITAVFFKVCTGAGPVDALKVQSLNSNTKVSKVQVHLLSEGPTRGLGVRLICWLMHFHSSEYQNTSPL